ncbi:threonyl-tRNA synthetase, partial [mine drainage metagenome]
LETVPAARPTHGPPTDEGFFYDFDVRPLTPEDLEAVRARIEEAVRRREPFVRREIPIDEARRLFRSNPHKLRYLSDVSDPNVSVYTTGSFVDLCRGPHVPDTGWLAGLHILGISAVHDGGREDGPMLQRIRGVGFPTPALRDQYLRLRQEAEARDHRGLSQRLELAMFLEEVPGFPIWLPRGMIVVRELERYVTEHLTAAGYSEVRTPLLFPQSVFETSGHWDHYRENIFLSTVDDRVFGWKPMNCPGSMLIFRSRPRSYRELPLRWAEFAPLHRREPSGTLHGLTRVREFVQDDAHLFVTEEQIEPEIRTLLDWVRNAFTTFRFEWSYELSTRPPGALGDAAQWATAEATLTRLLEEAKVPYRISPGEGAFYGPKIDIHLKDSLGRPWQTGTIQLDYQMPKRFGLEYQGADGQMHVPVVIHRTILGSWERFLGVLLEHTSGRLPPWLSPVQVRVLPIAEAHAAAAQSFLELLWSRGIRADRSESTETLPKRIRSAEIERIPYIAVSRGPGSGRRDRRSPNPAGRRARKPSGGGGS